MRFTNANSQAPPQRTESKALGWSPVISFDKPSECLWYMFELESLRMLLSSHSRSHILRQWLKKSTCNAFSHWVLNCARWGHKGFSPWWWLCILGNGFNFQWPLKQNYIWRVPLGKRKRALQREWKLHKEARHVQIAQETEKFKRVDSVFFLFIFIFLLCST